VRDISARGLGILVIRAKVGDTKTFTIPDDEFGEFAGFTFNAECRGIKKEPRDVVFSEFEISHISIGYLKEFQLLLHLAGLGDRSETFPSSRRAFFARACLKGMIRV
jgi:hypothetical protein